MAFCDFCKCDDCVNGNDWLFHAQTSKGFWICDVCWLYDLCTSGPERNKNGPCEEALCPHRPALVGPWLDLNGDVAGAKRPKASEPTGD